LRANLAREYFGALCETADRFESIPEKTGPARH
jgi:hypothetical protein